MKLTQADVAYVRANYRTLEELCEGRAESPDEVRELTAARKLPQPSTSTAARRWTACRRATWIIAAARERYPEVFA